MTASIRPEAGQIAPDFNLPALITDPLTLSALRGRNVVLYFYPKDNTPGCTTESIDFSTALADFDAANTVIIGVSRDSIKKHQNFAAKHDLTVELAADIDGEVTESYGVWVEKKMYGKTHMGIERATFLIDAEGVIKEVWSKVKVKGHVDAVLAAARAL